MLGCRPKRVKSTRFTVASLTIGKEDDCTPFKWFGAWYCVTAFAPHWPRDGLRKHAKRWVSLSNRNRWSDCSCRDFQHVSG